MARGFAYASEQAVTDEGMSSKDRIHFHYFNPHGLYAAWRDVNQRVADWCDEHPDRPNGVLMVHGSLNNHPYKMLSAGLDSLKKRREVAWHVNYAVTTLEEAIAKAEAFLADETKWPAPKAE